MVKCETDMTMERDRINQLVTSFLEGERQGIGKDEEKMETANNINLSTN
jgi:hypothetical protein